MHLPFHLVAGLGLIVALDHVSRHRTTAAAASSGVVYALAAAATAEAVNRGWFDRLGLAAWGIFLYGTVFVLGVAILLAGRARATAIVAGVTAFGLVAIALDAFVIEPEALELRRVTLASDKVTRRVRIAVLADLQAERIGDYERTAIRRVLAERPDLILMPGDYVQGEGTSHVDLGLRLNVLLRAEGWGAPRGVYAVRGNCEDGAWVRMFADLPVVTFERTRTLVEGELAITGLTLEDSFSTGVVVPRQSGFHIVVGHGPDFALSQGVEGDLLVAGHTHGGQVRLPLVGPLVTLSNVPRAWAAGVTRLPGERTLVVSRGVGMERGHAPRLRFLCRPEIVIVDVVPVDPEVDLPQGKSFAPSPVDRSLRFVVEQRECGGIYPSPSPPHSASISARSAS